MRRENHTLREIFTAGLADYLKSHWLPFYLLKAAYAIARCRTAALGVLSGLGGLIQ